MITFRSLILLVLLYIGFSCAGPSKNEKLRQQLNTIISGKNAVVGVGFMDLSTGDTLTINGSKHFPMQSVFKLHLALATLDLIEKRGLTFERQFRLEKRELLPDTHSPFRDDFPRGDSVFSLSLLLQYMISKSDNNVFDILLRRMNGPEVVTKYIHELGIKDVEITANEEAMHKDWDAQYKNWTTPYAALDLLKHIHDQSALSKTNNDFLIKTMIETSTGPEKIKGQLPEGTVVAHKTGASGKNDKGITGASNDVGIVTLPDGRQFAIAVFVTDSRETEEENEKIIATAAKAIWDYYQ